MKYVNLGRTGLKISQYIVGCDNFGDQTEEPASLRMLAAAADAGVNTLDTANSFVGGRSEEIVGKFLKGRRDEIVLATKCRSRVGDGLHDIGTSRKAIMKAIEDSLRRLKTDYIDLYQIHAFDPDTPLDEMLRTMDDLVHQGKVRYIGCSNFSGFQLTQTLWISDRDNLARMASTQPRYNMLYRHPELELLPACEEFGVGVIVYSPMAGGFLTGKHSREGAVPGTRFSEEFRASNFYRGTYWHESQFEAVDRYVEICEKYDVSPYQLGTKWVLKHPAITACIVGARTEEQLQANLRDWELPVPAKALEEAQEVADRARDSGPRLV